MERAEELEGRKVYIGRGGEAAVGVLDERDGGDGGDVADVSAGQFLGGGDGLVRERRDDGDARGERGDVNGEDARLGGAEVGGVGCDAPPAVADLLGDSDAGVEQGAAVLEAHGAVAADFEAQSDLAGGAQPGLGLAGSQAPVVPGLHADEAVVVIPEAEHGACAAAGVEPEGADGLVDGDGDGAVADEFGFLEPEERFGDGGGGVELVFAAEGGVQAVPGDPGGGEGGEGEVLRDGVGDGQEALVDLLRAHVGAVGGGFADEREEDRRLGDGEQFGGDDVLGEAVEVGFRGTADGEQLVHVGVAAGGFVEEVLEHEARLDVLGILGDELLHDLARLDAAPGVGETAGLGDGDLGVAGEGARVGVEQGVGLLAAAHVAEELRVADGEVDLARVLVEARGVAFGGLGLVVVAQMGVSDEREGLRVLRIARRPLAPGGDRLDVGGGGEGLEAALPEVLVASLLGGFGAVGEDVGDLIVVLEGGIGLRVRDVDQRHRAIGRQVEGVEIVADEGDAGEELDDVDGGGEFFGAGGEAQGEGEAVAHEQVVDAGQPGHELRQPGLVAIRGVDEEPAGGALAELGGDVGLRNLHERFEVDDAQPGHQARGVGAGEQRDGGRVPFGHRGGAGGGDVDPGRGEDREAVGVGGQPGVEVSDVAAGGGRPGDDGVATSGDAGGDDLGGGDAHERVPDAGADEPGVAGAAQEDAAAEHQLAVDVHEHEVVAQRDGEIVADGDVGGQRVHAEDELVDVLQLLAGGDVAAFVDADEDIFAAVGGAQIDAEAAVAHVEEERDGAVLERVAADEPGLRAGRAVGRAVGVEEVEGLDGLEHEHVVAGDDFAPVAEPGRGVVDGGSAVRLGPRARPEGVDHGDEGVGRPRRVHEQAVEAPRVAGLGVEGEHAHDEAQVVVPFDLAEVDGSDHLGAFVVLAVVAEREEEGEGAGLGLALEVGDDGRVVAGDALLELLVRLVAVLGRDPHRRGEEGRLRVVGRGLDGVEAEMGLRGEIPVAEGLHLAQVVPDERLLVHAAHGEGVDSHDGGPFAGLEDLAHGVVGAALGLFEGDEHGAVGEQPAFLVEVAHVLEGDRVVAALGEQAHLLLEHVGGDVGRSGGGRILDADVGQRDEFARDAHGRGDGRLEDGLAYPDLERLEEGDQQQHDAEEEHPGLEVALALDGGRAFPAFAVLDRFFSGAIHAVDDRFERDRRDWRGGLVDGFGGQGRERFARRGVVVVLRRLLGRAAPGRVVSVLVVHPRVPHFRPRSVKSAQ